MVKKSKPKKVEKDLEIDNGYQLAYALITKHFGKLLIVVILIILGVSGWQIRSKYINVDKQSVIKKELLNKK